MKIDTTQWTRGRRATLAAILTGLAFALPANASETQDRWESYLDHAYVYSSAEPADLKALLKQTTASVGRSLAEYHAETFATGSTHENPKSEIQIRRKAISELLLYRTGESPNGIAQAVKTAEALKERLDRPENRYWYHTIHAHDALREGDADAFVDQILTLWLEVITPLEVPFETYKTLALTQNGNAGFVRTLPHLYESLARLILVHSQSAALDGDIDSLGAIVRVLADQRVGSDPETIPVDATSLAFLDHLVARLDGPESDGGSLSYTLALIDAERIHQIARTELAEKGLTQKAEDAIRNAVSAYQRAMRNANTLQGQVAIYTRALRQSGEVFATAERTSAPISVDIPFSLERAFALFDTLQKSKDAGWERHGYVDQGRDAYIKAMQGFWSEIQEATFNAAHYYMSRRAPDSDPRDESIIHAINQYSAYLHAFNRYAGDPTGESLPDSAYFGAYIASRGIGDGVLFFDEGDASPAQLEEAVSRYTDALEAFPFDRELWSTLAVALQRSGRESDFLAVAKPIAGQVVRSRHVNRWIDHNSANADAFASFRRAFENDRSLVYFGFADADKVGAIEVEFAKLEAERATLNQAIAATRAQQDSLTQRRAAAHREAATLSGEASAAQPPTVTGAPPNRGPEIARLGLDLERLSTSRSEIGSRIEAISTALPTFKATIGHEDLIRQLATHRDHPVHALLRRFATELDDPTQTASPAKAAAPTSAWDAIGSWVEGERR